MDKMEFAARISWALETAVDEGIVSGAMTVENLMANKDEILRCEFDEDEIDELDESLVKNVFKSWVN